MGVDLRRCQRRVAEELLDGGQLGAVVEHVGGKAVAQHMGRASAGTGIAVEGASHYVVDELPVEGAAVGAHEEFAAGVSGVTVA